jgi:hypothetical protein
MIGQFTPAKGYYRGDLAKNPLILGRIVLIATDPSNFRTNYRKSPKNLARTWQQSVGVRVSFENGQKLQPVDWHLLFKSTQYLNT